MKGLLSNSKIVFVLIILNIFYTNCSFQTKIFGELNKEFIGENLIISPLSIFQLLSLATNGAKGKTQEAMLDTLEIESIENLNKVNSNLLKIFNSLETVNVANAIMTRITPIKNFTEIAKSYSATVEPLTSREQVNEWCNKTTHGRIPIILEEELDNKLRMLLLNAIYFKGQWECPFPKEDRDMIFYNFNKEEKTVKMMAQNDYFYYYEDEQVQVIDLPYTQDYMSAIIILPNKLIDINDYIESFRTQKDFDLKINEIYWHKLKRKKIDFILPKFEVNFSKNLNEVLDKLGMGIAFSEEANFFGITEEEILKMKYIIHKTFLKVDEDGTEATGATVGRYDYESEDDGKVYKMEVNRPFLLILRTGLFPEYFDMLFISKIEKL